MKSLVARYSLPLEPLTLTLASCLLVFLGFSLQDVCLILYWLLKFGGSVWGKFVVDVH